MSIRKFGTLLFILTFMFSLIGCTNNESKDIDKIPKMEKYAEEKYGIDFSVEYFRPAPGSSYNNVLTLSDGSNLFNVFCAEDTGKMRDDYAEVIIFDKYNDYLIETSNLDASDTDIYSAIILLNDKKSDYEYVINNDIETIMEESDVLKSIVVIKTTNFETLDKGQVFNIYNAILTNNPEIIDFNVISCDELNSKLKDSLTNMNMYYDNSWGEYSEIKEHIHIEDKNIKSPELLLKQAAQ